MRGNDGDVLATLYIVGISSCDYSQGDDCFTEVLRFGC